MKRDFSEIMSERTDKELVNITTIKQDEYEADAIIAALNELEKRQIDPSTFYTPDELSFEKDRPAREKESLPFTLRHKILIVALPALIMTAVIYVCSKITGSNFGGGLGFCLVIAVQWLIHRNLKENGYFKRAGEFKNWVIYTVYIYLAILILITIWVCFFMNVKE